LIKSRILQKIQINQKLSDNENKYVELWNQGLLKYDTFSNNKIEDLSENDKNLFASFQFSDLS
jgi:uncharacterized protein YfkK (UPF0435 family)